MEMREKVRTLLIEDDEETDNHFGELREEHGSGCEVHVPRENSRVPHRYDEKSVLES